MGFMKFGLLEIPTMKEDAPKGTRRRRGVRAC
ncbi:hypothetical protein ERO13_A05G300933v2 [Gossypium hirsutum]|nr:hypothetical protein ERO13_A05G300933v2 [Gossypium hirsutum]